MTIDEVIAHARERAEAHWENAEYANGCDLKETEMMFKQLAEEHEQLAEWLEELKALKSDDNLIFGDGLEQGYEEGYNKAIDEYMNLLCDHCMQQKNECYILECPFCTDGCDIVNIAQQLKEGGTDGSSTTDN